MIVDAYFKEDNIIYECPECHSEITISSEEKEEELAFGEVITDTCPECGVVLIIKMY